MRGFVKFAWLPLLAVAAFAAPISLNTNTGSGWQVSQTAGTQNAGALNTVTGAVALTGALPAPWVVAPSGSAWVGQLATDGVAPGAQPGDYRYTYTIASALLTGAGTISGLQISADNQFTLFTIVQGAQTYSLTVPTGGNTHASLISIPTFNFVGGADVVITAVVTNIPFSVEIQRTASGFLAANGVANVTDTGVPEPSTYAMLGLGSAALMFARLRRK